MAAFELLYRRWLSVREWTSVIGVILGAALGLVQSWTAGFGLAAVFGVMAFDSLIRRDPEERSITATVILDTTLIGIAVLVTKVPAAGIALPFAFIVTIALLVLRGLQSMAAVAYAMVWMLGLLVVSRFDWWATSENIGDDASLVAVVLASIISMGFVFRNAELSLGGMQRSLDLKIRYAEALSAVSKVMATRSDEAGLVEALNALLAATSARAVFVERNAVNAGGELCSTLIAEVTSEGLAQSPRGAWEMVPWTEMPMSFEGLSRGEAVSFLISELPASEAAHYAANEVTSELDIPIMIRGEWVGLIGFNDLPMDGTWDGHAITLLGTMAEMIASSWDREATNRSLQEAKDDLDVRLRYQDALTECSQLMLKGKDESSIDEALGVLLRSTEVDYVYIDYLREDPILGLCAEVGHAAGPDDFFAEKGQNLWEGSPMSDLPSTYSALSRGDVSTLHTRHLKGKEREIYEADGILSELNIPINVGGRWFGSIAFATYYEEREWSGRDINVLQTAAEMIGTFWDRAAARERLEEAVARLEQRHRLEEGIVKTSAALLRTDVSALDEVMAALREATGVDLVFADENFEDPELGLSARVISYVESGIDRPHPESEWWGGPYSELPTTCKGLSCGEVVIIKPHELEEPERSIYTNEGVKTELNVPISVRGEWRGSLGLTDYREERQWDPFDVELVVTASEMIGAHWERIEADRSMNVRLAYEKALARVSAELLSDSENAIDTAFEYLVAATDTDCMWMETNYVDPEEGISTRIVHEKISPRLDGMDVEMGSGWMGGPFSEAPTAYSSLSRGEPSIIQTVELSGAERQMYEEDGQKSELVIPMFVFGEWIGSVGFAHYLHSREWADEDISILRTAGGLIGSYLERRQTSERLQELVDSKDEFIASISHEIRTPLTSVLGFASVLRDDYEETPEKERREMLDLIGVEAQEVSWIVEDLLVFARSDIGTLAAVSVGLDLGEQVATVVAGQLGESTAGISCETRGDRAIGDPGRVRQIIRNLLTNAMKYGGPAVRVSTASDDRHAMVHVVDDGPGIDEKQREMVFDAFYRAHEHPGQPGSMGLGLHVSKQLAQLMDGDLTYERVSGNTRFTLSLPVAGQETHEAAWADGPLLRHSGDGSGVAPQRTGVAEANTERGHVKTNGHRVQPAQDAR